MSSKQRAQTVAVIGGGPAGLMAAEALVQAGVRVDVYDAMPSVGRKFLMAGKGGMNITHAEAFDIFVTRYGTRRENVEPLLRAFPPNVLREWINGLGIETFVGTSGRVFPAGMKAAPLLRAWLHRLRASGVYFHVRHRWVGWDEKGALCFSTPLNTNGASLNQFKSPPAPITPEGTRQTEPFPLGRGQGEGTLVKIPSPDAVILALGGGSWPQLGSDGAWVSTLIEHGATVAPLRPANCGFDVAWSTHFRQRFSGEPLKCVVALFGGERKLGESVITEHGIEGGLIYALSAALRDEIERSGKATLHLDLLPDRSPQQVLNEVSHPRGSRSISSHLQSRLGITGMKANLLREVLSAEQMHASDLLAATLKALPLKLIAPRPLSEAISSAGGVTFECLNENLMLKNSPGIFCAGEMLDWEAPTGGYLLSACLASGYAAGKGVLDWLKKPQNS